LNKTSEFLVLKGIMLKRYIFAILISILAIAAPRAQAVPVNADTVMVLPFENVSGKAEFNWVGESFADSLSDLLKVPSLNVISNDERKIIQQRLRIPLTNLPSLATSLKLARDANASLLITGKYNSIFWIGLYNYWRSNCKDHLVWNQGKTSICINYHQTVCGCLRSIGYRIWKSTIA